ncbi:MAG TPA: hypothetical protein VGZ03_03020 [Acidimicrobiales bacterium]|jgi:hypothetical protein|nr:hypothetical protein [Acidimicrobiales bacterium]
MTPRAAAAVVAVVAAGALAGCGSSVSPAAAVRSWAAEGSFGQGVQTLRRDATRVHDAIAARRAAVVLRTDCAELFQDANGENTDLLPTPDPQLTAHLSASYDGFVRAAAQCVSSPGEGAVLARVDRELALAIGDLYAGVLREEVVAARHLGVPGPP